jgi:hypothetical protein
VISLWEKDGFSPVNQAKSAHFVVFCDSAIPRSSVVSYMRNLSHFYSLFGFGELIPYGKYESFNFHRLADIRLSVQAFLNDQRLVEFQSVPVLVIAICDNAFGQDFQPRVNFTHVFPRAVRTLDATGSKALCFRLYAQFRSFISLPAWSSQVDQLFFGYRYAPPFLLPRPESGRISVHGAWHRPSSISLWTDDTGSTLAQVSLASIGDVARYIAGLRVGLEPLDVTFSLGLVGEILSMADVGPLQAVGALIFTILPAAHVQATPDGLNDIFVGRPMEQAFGDAAAAAPPLASAVVVAPGHCGYSMSLYVNAGRRRPDEALEWLAEQFSNLSWLSVLPGREGRVAALPPHVAALLRRTRSATLPMARFEFQ